MIILILLVPMTFQMSVARKMLWFMPWSPCSHKLSCRPAKSQLYVFLILFICLVIKPDSHIDGTVNKSTHEDPYPLGLNV